ncbi:MAG: arginine deiminase [Bacillota bacterium]|nr:arginine deiminase [Bacillota bacterium]
MRSPVVARHVPLHVTSEIGRLKAVLLHRPGREIENLTPELMRRLLFDDIPYLPPMQEEHDFFAGVLRDRGVEVLYLERLAAEALADAAVRESFVTRLLAESQENVYDSFDRLREYLLALPPEETVERVIAGVRKEEIRKEKIHLHERMSDTYPFYLDPMPNLLFTRDPAAVIGDGVAIHRLRYEARRRESLLIDLVIRHHPAFRDARVPLWFERSERFPLEGGDVHVLGPETVAVGMGERTAPQAVERLTQRLFAGDSGVRRVVAVEIPKARASMHLDTVFAMVDRDKFAVHAGVIGDGRHLRHFLLTPGERPGRIAIEERSDFAATLSEVLGIERPILIPCGGGDAIVSAREQWNEGSNMLTLAPGVVVAYDRNRVSNELLRRHGVEVVEIPSAELSRGRGGPRCMSMPLAREEPGP